MIGDEEPEIAVIAREAVALIGRGRSARAEVPGVVWERGRVRNRWAGPGSARHQIAPWTE